MKNKIVIALYAMVVLLIIGATIVEAKLRYECEGKDGTFINGECK